MVVPTLCLVVGEPHGVARNQVVEQLEFLDLAGEPSGVLLSQKDSAQDVGDAGNARKAKDESSSYSARVKVLLRTRPRRHLAVQGRIRRSSVARVPPALRAQPALGRRSRSAFSASAIAIQMAPRPSLVAWKEVIRVPPEQTVDSVLYRLHGSLWNAATSARTRSYTRSWSDLSQRGYPRGTAGSRRARTRA